jgi:hypothetical protein
LIWFIKTVASTKTKKATELSFDGFKRERPRPSEASAALRKEWLPFVDTYRTICIQPPAEFRNLLGADLGFVSSQ